VPVGAAIATAIVYVAIIFIQWRPCLRLSFESLYDVTSPVGRRVETNPFTPTMIGASAWFLVRVIYECRGPIAAAIGKGFSHPGHSLELRFEPPSGLRVNVEKPNGARVTSLRQGRRGVAIELPSPLPKGNFAAFQIEVIPERAPVPLPLVAKLVVVQGTGPAKRRLALVRTRSDLKLLQVPA
jgi:hypothetical protein